MRRYLILMILFLFSAASAGAQDTIPDKRFIVTRDVDFYGADLQALFDTNLSACRQFCLNDSSCGAFTFNTRSNACFPKSAVTERQPYEGAISGEVFTTNANVLERAALRRTELSFLRASDFSQALAEATALGVRHAGGQWTPEALLQAARNEEANGNLANAVHWTGAALAQTDASDLWVDYARLSLAYSGALTKSTDKRNFRQRALSAAINGYLRAEAAPVQVLSLIELAKALEDSGRGRDMIPALRLAEGLAPRADVSAMLEDAIGKYGFRIVEHEVESDLASPRICTRFSEDLVKAGADYTSFVRVPLSTLAIESDDRRICISGIDHGERYTVTFRSGLPSDAGETLIKDVSLTVYVPDRSPSASFSGRAYVLPKTSDAGIPIETVNVDRVDLKLRRVSDRNLLRAIQDSYFGRPLSYWEEQQFNSEIAEEVWTGVGEVENRLNANMLTRLPIGDVIADQPAGIYALTASLTGADPYVDPGQTQWFVLSDIGLATLSGTDGLHVFARRLTDATALSGIKVSLVSRTNRVLGTVTTNDLGHALFDPGLMRGTGGAAPAMVMAEQVDQDFTFLFLTDPAFDLSDRGVEGRSPGGPVDVFVSTDRGAYRAGETVFATALMRDSRVSAIEDVPLTAVLKRPDGVEYSRQLSATPLAGGHVFEMPLAPSVARGTWRLELFADQDAPALASQNFLVEDFVPERIDFDLDLPEGFINASAAPVLTAKVRYLFGAPGANLPAEGELRLHPLDVLDALPGYHFGRHDASRTTQTRSLPQDLTTDVQGQLQVALDLPVSDDIARPHQAEIILRVAEGSGRPVERSITRTVAPQTAMIGIKPLFDGVVQEGGQAAFELSAFGPTLAPTTMNVTWTLNRVNTRYQWYQEYGQWRWEPITTRRKVTSGTALLGDTAFALSTDVEWGQYELVVEHFGDDYIASSVNLYAGWYAPADVSSTPDTLALSLDKPQYQSGDTAVLRLVPRYAGQALVTVMSDHVISMQAYDVAEGENLISLDVTEDWGGGAYVTASVIRPMDADAGQNPQRSLGLAHAAIDPGARRLSVRFDAPLESQPRGPLDATIIVDGLKGQKGFVTVAAVDVGILNLTRFDSPDPSDHYFGQRRLGVEIRDIYGRLINGMDGAMGTIRSGGDAAAEGRLESPPPTEELVAFFSGPVEVQADGTANVRFDLPEFNGTVRLMAVTWSPTAVGEAEADVLVRDPVVVTASLPRFLAPGDQSRLLLEIVHSDGPAGEMMLEVGATGIDLQGSQLPEKITLAEGGSQRLTLPITARDVGDHQLTVALTTPDGIRLEKTLTLGVRANDPEISQTRRFSLAPSATFTLDDQVFDGFLDGSSQALVSAGPLARFDAPGLIASLDRYPYGCTEQVTSGAMPLLYLSSVAVAMGLGDPSSIDKRIAQSITKIMTRQASNGAFGLWRAQSGDFWLDAYVSDFLSRARAQGHDVPDLAFRNAMDNLRNRIAYAPDFDKGGADIAYALLVLAREGHASMGDLRYYADVKADAFSSSLAQAQLGAALAMYGDQTRADLMFAKAARRIAPTLGTETTEWRADYGSNLRDAAGLLALAVEAGSTVVDRDVLTARLSAPGRGMSTQEQSWALMAAHAMVQDPNASGITLDGAAIAGPFVRRIEGRSLQPMEIRNTSTLPTDITLTTIGVPEQPLAAGGYGYAVERAYYTMEGQPAEGPISVGDRYVTVMTVRPAESTGARLMVNDPLPAGFEIDNPNLLRSGDIRALDWLKPAEAEYTEFRSDRFLAAVNWQSKKPFQLAYIVRAVSPGTYHHPAASVEDMYRPRYRARTDTGRIVIAE